jgi:hypothetical protein
VHHVPGIELGTQDLVVKKIFKQNGRIWGKNESSLSNPSVYEILFL